MAEEKVLLTDEEVNVTGGDDADEMHARRMNYLTQGVDFFTQFNHKCPYCHTEVIRISRDSLVCDKCQIRFIEYS